MLLKEMESCERDIDKQKILVAYNDLRQKVLNYCTCVKKIQGNLVQELSNFDRKLNKWH